MMSQVSGHSGAPRPKPSLPAMRALNSNFEQPWHLSMSWQISTGVPITPSPQKTDEGNKPVFPEIKNNTNNNEEHPVPYNLRNLPDHPYHRPHDNLVQNFSSTDSEGEMDSKNNKNSNNNNSSSANLRQNSCSSSNRKLSFSNVNHHYQNEMHPGSAAAQQQIQSFNNQNFGKAYADYQIMTRSQAAMAS